jgi:hypothetical protein
MNSLIKKALKDKKANEVAGLVLTVLPAFFLALMILKYAVNVPVWDQWATPGSAFLAMHNNSFSLGELLAGHNEGPLLFPKLIFIGLAFLTAWNTQYEMLLTFIIACIISYEICCLARITAEGSRNSSIWVAIVCNILIFSPIQYENWLMGFQLVILLPTLCVVSSILVAQSRLDTRLKFILCVILSTVSTFSFPNGFLCWIAATVSLRLSPSWMTLKSKFYAPAIWTSALILNVVLVRPYFKTPDHDSKLTDVLTDPHKTFTYFTSFLGAPLGQENLEISSYLGLLIFSLFVFLSGYLLLRCLKKESHLKRPSTWMILGGYVIASGTINTLGRVGLGVEHSLSSRYTGISCYLIISVLYLLIIAVNDMHQTRSFEALSHTNAAPRSLLNKQVIVTSVLTSVVVLSVLSAVQGGHKMHSIWRERLYGKACLTYINFVDETCVTHSLYSNIKFLKERANAAEALGLIEHDLAKEPEIRKADVLRFNREDREFGFFESLNLSDQNVVTVSGWAVLPYRNRAADAVILTYLNASKKPEIFAIAPVRSDSNLTGISSKDKKYPNAGWTISFSLQQIPIGKLKIHAYAFDSQTNQSYRLKKSHTLQARP